MSGGYFGHLREQGSGLAIGGQWSVIRVRRWCGPRLLKVPGWSRINEVRAGRIVPLVILPWHFL